MPLTPRLRAQFPRTAAAFAAYANGSARRDGAADADEHLSRIVALERAFGRRDHVEIAVRDAPGPMPEFDAALAGGGLSLIYAAVLARAGLRVAVFDRGRIGCGHREWNISLRELAPLWESGLFTEAEARALVRMQYRTGLCRFAAGRDVAESTVDGVLDCVIDAEALLTELRRRAQAAGAQLLDHHALAGYAVDRSGVTVSLRPVHAGGAETARPEVRLRARLLLDGLGASSPHARFDLCCPTVGGVMDGLAIGPGRDEMDPAVGEILVTTEGVEDGRQHVWEGFPAPPEEPPPGDPRTPYTRRMTVYLFYYVRADDLAGLSHPLLALYERFFATLPRYKRGPLTLVRPTYGFIPAYTRLGPMPAAPRSRVLLVGDAAGRHSPLTFCGFGSMVRSFWPVAQGIERCLRQDRLTRADLESLWREPPALQVMGGLTLMMMPAPGEDGAADPDGINALLGSAFTTLAALGPEVYARFLQDDVDAATFVRFMRGAAARHPAVYAKAFRHLSPAEVTTWLWRLFRLWRQTRGAARPA